MPEPDDKLMTALAEFAAGAGHEINNPLAIISGHAQVLLEKTESPDQRRRLAAIISQTKRAYEMIADLRLFGSPPEPSYSLFNFKEFFDRLIVDHSGTDAEFPVTISVEYDENNLPKEVRADRSILRMVFDALLRNAHEAVAPKEARVRIAVSADVLNRRWHIVLNDNGPGIPPQLRSRIFLPYFSGRNAGRGLGFGLPRSWALVKRMGGELSLEDRGFVITLPLSENGSTSCHDKPQTEDRTQ